MSANASHNVSLAALGCFASPPASYVFTGFTVTNTLLLLPLSLTVLSFLFRRRREPMSPLDVFTYHMAAMELIGVGGSLSCCCGAALRRATLTLVGCNAFAIVSCVKMLFHVLTCVERYVAVVHPVVYLRLSRSGGVAVRNAAIGCVWAAFSGLTALRVLLDRNFNMILFFSNLVLALAVSSFCSLSVLRVLRRPGPGAGAGAGPGAGGGNGGKPDALKRKAFVTIAAIGAVLMLRFGGNLVCLSLASSAALGAAAGCVVRLSGVWFCLPSSYVLPLLFLHRAGKLPCFNYDSK